MLCAFKNPDVRMAWNTYMHVECQNPIVYKAQYTRKREDTVFKTKYCSSYLYSNFVKEMGNMKFSVYLEHSKGHEYAPWQYEHMPNKSMVN